MNRQLIYTIIGCITAVLLMIVIATGVWFGYRFMKFESDMSISAPAASTSGTGEIVIDVLHDGTLEVDKSSISKVQLLEMLEKISSEFPDQAVILRAGKNADFQELIEILDQIKEAGIWNVAFASRK